MKAIRFSDYLKTTNPRRDGELTTAELLVSDIETLRNQNYQFLCHGKPCDADIADYALRVAMYGELARFIAHMDESMGEDFLLDESILSATPHDIRTSLREWPDWNDAPGILVKQDFSGIRLSSLRCAFSKWTFDAKTGEFFDFSEK